MAERECASSRQSGPDGRTARTLPSLQCGQPGAADLCRALPTSERGVEANTRLTAMTAVVLLGLLAAKSFAIPSVRSLLSVHVPFGTVLVPRCC
jgi:hypothetical protein